MIVLSITGADGTEATAETDAGYSPDVADDLLRRVVVGFQAAYQFQQSILATDDEVDDDTDDDGDGE